MATIRPFAALRPNPEEAASICSKPYDVVSADEARAIAEGNPLCFLRVTRPEIELDPDCDPSSPDTYAHGGAKLQEMIRDGHLVQDSKPCLYYYRLTWRGREQTGLVGVFSCDEYERNVIRKHELTRPDKEEDRKEHINRLGAQTGPVFLAHRSNRDLDAIATEECAKEPAIDFEAEDGVRHTAWVVDDEATMARIHDAFSRVPTVYIADGHHRSAAACRVAAERREANPGHTGEEPYNFFLGVTFPHRQLRILGYNRVVRDLNGLTTGEFLAALCRSFALEPSERPVVPERGGSVGMYLLGTWYSLEFIPGDGAPTDVVSSLDASFLQNNLLAPILGIENPRTDKRIAFVGGIRGTEELEKMVDGGEWVVAFNMHPTSIEELMAVADANSLMPPKSTWFEPKLRDAMMVHLI